MNYIKHSEGTAGKWAPVAGQWEHSMWSWGECSVVSGAMYFGDVSEFRWYYPYFMDTIRVLWILSSLDSLQAT